MTWFDILKIIGVPTRRLFLSIVVVNREEFENTLEELRKLEKVPRQLQGVLNNEKSHKAYYDEGVEIGGREVTLSEEESKEMFDEMLQIIAEKTEKFTERRYYSINKIRELISEAMKAKNEGDKEKVSEIILEITENMNPKREFLKDYIPERDKLNNLKEFLDERKDSAFISFENPPSDKKILEEFVKLLNSDEQNPVAELDNDIIYVEVENRNEYIKMLQPILEFYNKNIRDLKPVFEFGGKKLKIDPNEQQIRDLNIRDAKYELVGDFTESEVFKYIDIVNTLAGSVRLWKITNDISSNNLNDFANGNEVPQELFLGTGANQLNLSPYARILIDNVYNDNWFTLFFQQLRSNAVLTFDEAELLMVDDIYNTLMNTEGNQTPLYKINITPFRNNEKIRKLRMDNKPKKRIKEVIRQIISNNQGEGQLGEDIKRKLQLSQRTQLQYLSRYFTGKEASAVKKVFEEIDPDIETTMYNSLGGKTENPNEAIYYEFEVYGEELNPSNLNEMLEAYELTLDEEGVDTEGLKRTLESLNQRLSEIKSKKTTEATPTDRLKQSRRIKRQIEETEKKIKRRETVGPLDISELRETIANPTNFSDFVTSIASKQSIDDLISQGMTSAEYLEQVNPKNSLIFLSAMSERAGNDEVGEAFNKINDNPTSEASQKVLDELNDKMPQLLTDMKKQLIEVFQRRLQFFVDNYGQKFPRQQVGPAIQAFENNNLIREVQE